MEGTEPREVFQLLEALIGVGDMSELKKIIDEHEINVEFGMYVELDMLGSEAEGILGRYKEQKLPLPEVFGSCLKEIACISSEMCSLVNTLEDLDKALEEHGSLEELLRQIRETAKVLLGKLKPEVV